MTRPACPRQAALRHCCGTPARGAAGFGPERAGAPALQAVQSCLRRGSPFRPSRSCARQEQGARLVERIAVLERRPGLKGRNSGKLPSSGGLAKPAVMRRTRGVREKTGARRAARGDAAACGAPGSCGGSCPGVLPGVWGVLVRCGGCAPAGRPSGAPLFGGGGALGSRAALRLLRGGGAVRVPGGRVGPGAIGSASCGGGGAAASWAAPAGAASFGGSVCVVRGAGVSGGAGGGVRPGCGAAAAGGCPCPGAAAGRAHAKHPDETGLRVGGRGQARCCRRRIGRAGGAGLCLRACRAWRCYWPMKGVGRALCTAHPLRALQALAAFDKEDRVRRMRRVLRRARSAARLARDDGAPGRRGCIARRALCPDGAQTIRRTHGNCDRT